MKRISIADFSSPFLDPKEKGLSDAKRTSTQHFKAHSKAAWLQAKRNKWQKHTTAGIR
jgi:hypothetical protein